MNQQQTEVIPQPAVDLLIISRDNLILAADSLHGPQVLRLLAQFTRRGCNLLLTAAEPDAWSPTRGNLDSVLLDQVSLKQRIVDCGGDLDGVYYVPRSVFTQDRNRRDALNDILTRYGLDGEAAALLSSSLPFLKAARSLGMQTSEIPEGPEGVASLAAALAGLLDNITN